MAGNIRANQIVVNTNGADFVFDPSYKLNLLADLKKYILSNHHLPEIEPAEEMQVNGLSLGDNQIKLLQKVEELTLYIINKDEEIKELQTQIENQQTTNRTLNSKLEFQQQQINHLIEQVNTFAKTAKQ